MTTINENIENIIENNMAQYSSYILLNRALPDLRDGLKPVYRRILWAMYQMKATRFTKSANVTGEVFKYHPHGDCLSGDTKMFLLSGGTKTLKELESNSNEEWVLSVDENGEIVPAMAFNFRKVKKVNKLKVITFANGFQIKSTDDHKFRLISDEWLEAKDIKPGHIIDYGKIKPGKYSTIFGNKTKTKPIHKLVDDYINEMPIKKDEVVHHLDHDTLNNSPNNLQRTSRSAHLAYHTEKDGLSLIGAKKSYYNLFDKNGAFYEKNRNKNSELAKQLNKHTGLVRANATLNKMKERGISLTYENYEKMRSEVYNLTRIETLVKNGIIKDFDDLVKKNKQGIKFINYEKKVNTNKKGQNYSFVNKTEQHKEKCGMAAKRAAGMAGLKKAAKNSNFDFEKIKALKSFASAEELPLVVSVEYIEADEVVYDFSVEETHNALISVSEDDTLLAVAHNCYPTVVGMVQKDRHIVPFLEGKGSFGQYSSRDLTAAASRYSEVKLGEISLDMLRDCDKNMIDFIDNYDGTKQIPEVLPTKFPAVLVYAQSGIGVGFSNSMPSFNLNELTSAIIKYLNEGKKTLLVPDFAMGGSIIEDEEVFKKINLEGNGTVVLRGKASIENNTINITEIPYSTTREAIIDKVVDLAKTGKLKEVTSIKDLTGLNGMLVSITARKNTDMKLLLAKLYKLTPLEASYSSNMNILCDDLPKVMGVWNIIEEWTKWRRDCINRGLISETSQMKKKMHLLKGLEKVLLNVDKAVEIIRFSKETLIEKNLMKEFVVDEAQAKEIGNMKLRDINKDYIVKKIADIKGLEDEIKHNEFVIGNEKELNKILIDGLKESAKKYGSERRTKIIKPTEPIKISFEEEAPNYEVKLYLTKDGYCYKFKNTQIEPNLKPGDEVLKTFTTNNKAEILIFGKDKHCYKVKINEVEETSTNAFGTFLPAFLKEKIDIITYSILDKHKMLLMVYTNNKIAKVNAESYNVNRKVLKKSTNDKQDLLEVISLFNDIKLKLITSKTKVDVDTKDISLTNLRSSTGIFVTRKGEAEKTIL